MDIRFFKMHGAANDFVLVDDRTLAFPAQDRQWIAAICARRTGIGCEGLILIQPSAVADVRMRFFNPDGGEVDMCGNGARCLARLAFELGAVPASMTMETRAGRLSADVLLGGRVRLTMTPPTDWRMGRHLHVAEHWREYHFVNTGVPHAVLEVDDLDAVDVADLGPGIRHHSDFQPAGTNVDFVQVTGPRSLRVRTYERGVEAETLACGTGIVAAALTMARAGRLELPADVTPASGDLLEVDARPAADGGYEGVTLTGPAEHVFEGTVRYPGPSAARG